MNRTTKSTLLVFILLVFLQVSTSDDFNDPQNFSPEVKKLSLFEIYTEANDPYMHFDPELGGYIECEAWVDGKHVPKKCLLSEKIGGSEQILLSCHTAFSIERGVLYQGCYTHAKEFVEELCTIGSCGTSTRIGDVHFCCCRVSFCNRDSYIRPDTEDSPSKDHSGLE